MRVTVDATPLIGDRTGVGSYVHHLLLALAPQLAEDEELRLGAVTWRGRDELADGRYAPLAGRRVPARLVRRLWERTALPSAELVLGPADVVHGTNFVLPPPRRAAGVVTVHDLAFVLRPETVSPGVADLARLVPRALESARFVLTPSQAAADDVMAVYGVEPGRVRVTPLGVDDAWFGAAPPDGAARGRLGLPSEYVVFVGTREPRKNLPVLLEAHHRWRSADPSAPALVLAGPAGWGPTDGSPGTEDGVVRTGYLGAGELRSVVAGSLALVLPSVHEGFGLPVLEAMATGRPVVTSDLPVLREVSGGLALTAPVDDPDALADQLRLAAHDHSPDAVARRTAHARSATWSRCARLTLEAYRDAAR